MLNVISVKIVMVSIIENIDWKDCIIMEGILFFSWICNFLFFEIYKKRFVDNIVVSIVRKILLVLVLL